MPVTKLCEECGASYRIPPSRAATSRFCCIACANAARVVLLGIQSRDFSNRLGLAFVTWLEAFGAESGVKFKAWESDQ